MGYMAMTWNADRVLSELSTMLHQTRNDGAYVTEGSTRLLDALKSLPAPEQYQLIAFAQHGTALDKRTAKTLAGAVAERINTAA